MATRLYLHYSAEGGDPLPNFMPGITESRLAGGSSFYVPMSLTPAAVSSRVRNHGLTQPETISVTTVTGPTSGLEFTDTNNPAAWVSEPLDADTTISGTITLNFWAHESAMTTNAAINAIIERVGADGVVISTIAQTARTTELGTTNPPTSAQNFTVTPTSTTLQKGDRIRVRVYIDDAGTMGAGSVTLWLNGETDAANGDSWIEFTETIGFLTADDFSSSTSAIAGTGANIALGNGGTTWTNPGNVTADDGNGASVTLSPIGQPANGLMGRNFGFAIPTGATITGIEVEVDVISEAALPNYFVCSLTKDATATLFGNHNYGRRYAYDGTGLITFGGPDDLWEASFTEEEIESANFGAVFWCDASTVASTLVVDFIRVRVYYWTSGSKYYLTNNAGPAVGANLEKLLSTTRGGGVQSAVTNTSVGPVTPIQMTDSGGGTALEWYTPQLEAFTLSGMVQLHIGASVNDTNNSAGMRAELAVCDSDGSNVTVWASNGRANGRSQNLWAGRLSFAPVGFSSPATIAENRHVIRLAADDLSVASGQRLRLRLFVDDASSNLTASDTVTLYYAGASNATGDSWIQFAQTITESAPAVLVLEHGYVNHQNPGIL